MVIFDNRLLLFTTYLGLFSNVGVNYYLKLKRRNKLSQKLDMKSWNISIYNSYNSRLIETDF